MILLLIQGADVSHTAGFFHTAQVVDVDGAIPFKRPMEADGTQRQERS